MVFPLLRNFSYAVGDFVPLIILAPSFSSLLVNKTVNIFCRGCLSLDKELSLYGVYQRAECILGNIARINECGTKGT